MGVHVYDRMRNAAILVVNFRGLATETIKNIVLAGIGKLIIWDGEDVVAEDLGAGFFFRDEDVGKKVRSFFCALLILLPFLRQSTYPVPLLPPPPLLLLLPLPLMPRPTCGVLLTAMSCYSAWMRRKLVSRA